MAPGPPEQTREYRNHHLDSTRWDGFVRARRRHRRHDRLQGGHHVDAAHPRRARVRSRAACRSRSASSRRGSTRDSWDRSSRCWQASKRSSTAASSRAISRPTGFGSSRRRSTSSSGATRATCSCRCSITTPATPTSCTRCSTTPTGPGPEFPRCPATPRELWPRWISEGWFDWEPDGWPFWSHHHHLSTWWEVRDLPNVLFVHFGDLKADPEAEIRRIAAFCDIEIDEGAWPALARDASASTRCEPKRGATDDPHADGVRRRRGPVLLQGRSRSLARRADRRRSRALRDRGGDARSRPPAVARGRAARTRAQ